MFVDLVLREEAVADIARAVLSKFDLAPGAAALLAPLRRLVCAWSPASTPRPRARQDELAQLNLLRFNLARDAVQFTRSASVARPAVYEARGLAVAYTQSVIEGTIRLEGEFATPAELAAADLGPTWGTAGLPARPDGRAPRNGPIGAEVPVVVSSVVVFTPANRTAPPTSALVITISGSADPMRPVPAGPPEFGGREPPLPPPNETDFQRFFAGGIPIRIELADLESALGGIRFVASNVRYFDAERLVVLRLGFVPSATQARNDAEQTGRDIAQVASEMLAFGAVPGSVFAARLWPGSNASVSITQESMGQIASEIVGPKLESANLFVVGPRPTFRFEPRAEGVGFHTDLDVRIKGACPSLIPVDLYSHIAARGSITSNRQDPQQITLRINELQNDQMGGSSLLCAVVSTFVPVGGGAPSAAPVIGSFLGASIGSAVASTTTATSVGGAVGGAIAIAATLIAITVVIQTTRISLQQVAASSNGTLAFDGATGSVFTRIQLGGPWREIALGPTTQTDPLNGGMPIPGQRVVASLAPLGLGFLNGTMVFGLRVSADPVGGSLVTSSVAPAGAPPVAPRSSPVWRAGARSCASSDDVSAALVVRVANRTYPFDMFPDNATLPMEICAFDVIAEPVNGMFSNASLGATIDVVSSANQLLRGPRYRIRPGEYVDVVVSYPASAIQELRRLSNQRCTPFNDIEGICTRTRDNARRALAATSRLVIRTTAGRRLVQLPPLSTLPAEALDDAAALHRVRCATGRLGIPWVAIRSRVDRPAAISPAALVERLVLEPVFLPALQIPRRDVSPAASAAAGRSDPGSMLALFTAATAGKQVSSWAISPPQRGFARLVPRRVA